MQNIPNVTDTPLAERQKGLRERSSGQSGGFSNLSQSARGRKHVFNHRKGTQGLGSCESKKEERGTRHFWGIDFYLGFSQWLEPLCLQNNHSTGNASPRLPRTVGPAESYCLKYTYSQLTNGTGPCTGMLAFTNLPTVAPNSLPIPSSPSTWKAGLVHTSQAPAHPSPLAAQSQAVTADQAHLCRPHLLLPLGQGAAVTPNSQHVDHIPSALGEDICEGQNSSI